MHSGSGKSTAIRRIAARHRIPAYLAVPYEIFIRAYRFPFLRFFLKRFFREYRPEGMIFVIGSYNSGTTIIKNAIAAHPDVASAPIEGDRLTTALCSFEEGGWPRGMYGNCVRIHAQRKTGEVSAKRFFSDLRPWLRDGKQFLEKSISNTVRIPALRKAFPGARFICVTRDPEAVANGIARRSRPQGLAAKILDADRYPKSFLFRQWIMFYRLVVDDVDNALNDIYFCSYEKFVESPHTQLEGIFEHIGLKKPQCAFSRDLLRVGDISIFIHNRKASSTTFSPDQVDDLRLMISDIEKDL